MTSFRSNLVRPVSSGLLAVLMIGGISVAGHPAGAADSVAAPASASIGKPTGPLEVSIRSNGAGRATVRVQGNGAIARVAVTLATTGEVTAGGARTVDVAPGRAASVRVTYSAASGRSGTVVARARGIDAAGRTVARRSDVLPVRESYGTLLASDQGTLDLQLQHLRRAHDLGKLDDAAYAKATSAARSGGAAQRITVRSGVRPGVGTGAGNATVAGQIRWTDPAGGTHPVRGATVQIRDQETSGSIIVSTVTTNDTGDYTSTFGNDDGPGEGVGRDLFIIVYARGAGFTVQTVAGSIQRIQSGTTNNVPDGTTLTVNMTANNTADNNTAFSVQDALITATRYFTQVNGSSLATFPTVFPTDESTSLYDGTSLHVLLLDRFDHDVIGHELGHYVQDVLNIEENPGGAHSFDENLAETKGKADGIHQSWGEGWPTYFAISAQLVMGTSAQNIPNVGDTSYTDTEDSNNDVSAETAAGGASVGEDNELSVIRVLFDLYDSSPDTGDTRGVALGDQALWNATKSSTSVTLNELYNTLVVGKSQQQVADYGCILGTHKIAPEITSPATGTAPAAPPTITWARNGLGPSFRNNRFTVKYFNSADNTVLFTSPVLNATSYTPSRSEWDTILGDSGNKIDVVVNGGNTAAPATGPYTSCNVSLTQPK